MDITLRPANIGDTLFLVKTIIEAEKSNTKNCGLAKIFGLSEMQLGDLIHKMLDEEIDGCEFSISSYIIADVEKKPVAAFGGWIEQSESPSYLLKSNLITFTFSIEAVLQMKGNADIVKGLSISREPKTLQLEYLFVEPNYRGLGLAQQIIEKHLDNARLMKIGKIQVQLFANNAGAINLYQKCGFTLEDSFTSEHPQILEFLPHNKKILMYKTIL